MFFMATKTIYPDMSRVTMEARLAEELGLQF